MHKIFVKKIITAVAVYTIIIQSLTPFLALAPKSFAQEATPTVTPAPTDIPTSTPTVTSTPVPTDTTIPTPTPVVSPVPTDTPLPTDTATPTPTPVPTDTATPTPTPVDNLSPPSNDNNSNSSNNNQVQSASVSPTPTDTATPTPTPEPTTGSEQVNLVILKNTSAPAIDLSATVSQGSAVLTTDKPDYAPTDTALITGKNLNPNTDYILSISSQDQPPIGVNVQVKSDNNGEFAYAYQLDGTYRPNYKAELRDLAGNVVATTTFLDHPPVCNAGYTLQGQVKGGSYTSGNLCSGPGNCWAEGENIPARLVITGLSSGTTYSVVVEHDFQLSGLITGYTNFNTPTSGNSTATGISFSAPTTVSCGGSTTCKDYTLTFTASSSTVQLDWFAKLGNNAAQWSGGSLHYRLINGACSESVGNKDVPINPQNIVILGSISPIKSTANGANPNDWTFNITGNTNVSGVASGGTAQNLALGTNNGNATYTITEVGPTGWVMNSVSSPCLKTGDFTATVTLTSGNPDITCTFTNKRTSGTIELKKAWVGVGGQTTLNIGTTVGASNVDTQLTGVSGAAPLTTGSNTVNSGTYYVSETGGLDNYSSSLNCTKNGQNYTPGTGNSLVVSTNDVFVCTFTNTRKTGHVTFTKIVSGGSSHASDWTFNLSGIVNHYHSGDSPNINTGTYTLTESGPDGYTLTNATGICSLNPDTGVVTLSVTADGGTCTITNTRDTGLLTVHKLVDRSGNGTFTSGDDSEFQWKLDSGSYNEFGDTLSNVSTLTTHSIRENSVSGYHFVGWFVNGTSDHHGNAYTCTNLPDHHGSLPATFSLQDKNDSVVITFCNARDTGSITVNKVRVPDSVDGSFNINLTSGDLTVHSSTLDSKSNYTDTYSVGTGTYVLGETSQDGWTLTSATCTKSGHDDDEDYNFSNFSFNFDHQNPSFDPRNGFTVNSGDNIICTFTNSAKAHITVEKLLYQSGDSEVLATNDNTSFNFSLTAHDNFNLSNGQSQSFDVTPGTYTVTENTDDNYDFLGCTADYKNGGEGVTIENGETVTVGAGDSVTVTCENAQKTGTISGDKFNDINNSGQECNNIDEDLPKLSLDVINFGQCQPKLPGWHIQLFQNNDGVKGNQVGNDAITNSDGNYLFTNVLPGSYFVCEVEQPGWQQTYPNFDSRYPNCWEVTVGSNEEATGKDFGNHNMIPILTISKSNDASGNKVPGDNVGFTLTIQATQSAAQNVTITDLLPSGFHFNAGSWKVVSSDTSRGVLGDITSLLTAPTYHSPGTWTLGSLAVGETLTLTYTANIDGSQQTGTYYDNAWGQGQSLSGQNVLANALPTGFVDTNFVGTQVAVINGGQAGVTYNTNSTQSVLGASTGPELPSTGESTLWVIIATLMLGLGAGTVVTGFKLKKRYE